MKGKYCDYYWSVKKEKEGYIWHIRSSHEKGAEVIQSSTDEDWIGENYYETDREARADAKEAIRDYYSF